MNFALWLFRYPGYGRTSQFTVSRRTRSAIDFVTTFIPFVDEVIHCDAHEPTPRAYSEVMLHGYFRFGLGFADGMSRIGSIPVHRLPLVAQ